MFVCHHNDVCEDSICSVYVGGFCDLSEIKLCVFRKLCPVGFSVVCKCLSECLSVLLQSMSCCMLIVVIYFVIF